MIKKEFGKLSILLLVVLLSASFVSANLFGDFFSKVGMTGNAVASNSFCASLNSSLTVGNKCAVNYTKTYSFSSYSCCKKDMPYSLVCQKSSQYTTSYSKSACNASDCGKDKYISCQQKTYGGFTFGFMPKQYAEVCQKITSLQNISCSLNPTCPKGYSQFSRNDCSAQNNASENPYQNILNSCNIDFVDSNNIDVQTYLGPYIHPLKESDWMHNPNITQQVKVLIDNKNNDMDKAVAIANWVKQSRPYNLGEGNSTCSDGGCTPANALLSVMDIYNENTGVCFDSAIITVAMFRLAGIPARLTFPIYSQSHARTQAYIKNQWITFDSTFSSGAAEVNIAEFPPDVVSYSGELNNLSIYNQQQLRTGEYLGSEVYKQFDIANNDSVFGAVTLANIPSNNKLYSNDSLFDNSSGMGLPVGFNIERVDDVNLYYAVYNSQINYVFNSSQPSGVIINGGAGSSNILIPYSNMSKDMNLILPRIMFFDGFNDNIPGVQVNSVIDMSGSFRYLETIKLPLGEYKITYYTNLPSSTDNPNVGGQKDVAYAEFNVSRGNAVKLTSNIFKKSDGINQVYFNDMMKRIDNTWSNCANNSKI